MDNKHFLVSTCNAVGVGQEVGENFRKVPEATLQAVVGAPLTLISIYSIR
jgi:hypothetical protein